MKKIPIQEQIANELRDLIHRIPELNVMPEKEYCEIVLEGIDIVTSGLKMRLEELDEDDE